MNSKREYNLDVLKCLATIVVVFHHYQQSFKISYDSGINWYRGNFYWGYMVELFFILSGYFTYTYMARIDDKSRFADFFKKKYLRFLPMLVISGSVSIVLGYVNARLSGVLYECSVWKAAASLSGVSRWLNTNKMINNPVWYISILLFCYVVFFAGTYAARRLKINPLWSYLCMVGIGLQMRAVCAGTGTGFPFYHKDIARGLICFFFGLLLRYLIEKYRMDEKWKWFLGSVTFVILFVYIYAEKYHYVESGLYYSLCFLVFPAVILIFKSRFLAGFFRHNVFKNWGSVSFNVFVWHAPMLALTKIIRHFVNIKLDSPWAMLLWTLGVFGIGTISFLMIEKPISRKLSM